MVLAAVSSSSALVPALLATPPPAQRCLAMMNSTPMEQNAERALFVESPVWAAALPQRLDRVALIQALLAAAPQTRNALTMSFSR